MVVNTLRWRHIEVEGGDGGEDIDLNGGDGDIDLDDEDNDLDNIALH